MAWLRFKSVVRIAAEQTGWSFLICCLFAGATGIELAAGGGSSNLGLALLCSATLTAFCTSAGEHGAVCVLNRNATLFYLTPLRPALLLRHNFVRVCLPLFCAAVAGPVGMGWALATWGTPHPGSEWPSAFGRWQVVADIELTSLALLLVPLYARLTARRWLVRILAPWSQGRAMMYVRFPGILAVIIGCHIPLVVRGWQGLAEYLADLGQSGALGDTLVYLLVPFYSLTTSHGATDPQYASFFTLGLALAVAVMARGIARRLRVDMPTAERDDFSRFLDWREAQDEGEERPLQSDGYAWDAADNDGAIEDGGTPVAGPGSEPAAPASAAAVSRIAQFEAGLPDYRHGLDPEAQAIRHTEHWLSGGKPSPARRSALARILRVLLARPWLTVAVVAWGGLLYSWIRPGLSTRDAESVRRATACFLIAVAYLAMALRCVDSGAVGSSLWVAVPGRWHRLMRHRLSRQVRLNLAADLLAAALFCTLGRSYHPLVFAAAAGTLLASRLIGEVMVFLGTRHRSGRNLAYVLACVSFLTLLPLGGILSCVVLYVDEHVSSAAASTRISGAIAGAAIGTATVSCLALLGWEHWRGGSQVVIPVESRRQSAF